MPQLPTRTVAWPAGRPRARALVGSVWDTLTDPGLMDELDGLLQVAGTEQAFAVEDGVADGRAPG
jgi:hypothetical protein